MKINTISAYVLVYLLARGHWNLMVPVRAEVEGDGSSGSASADGGSASETPADGSTPAAPASESGSTASPDAGSTLADGSGYVAGGSSEASTDADSGHVDGSDADGSAGSPADAGSSGGASTDADELGSLYPDFFTGGMSADEAPITNPELVAKREEARRLAENARKTAEELMKAAEKMLKDADELSRAIEYNGIVEEFTAKMEAIVHDLTLDRSKAAEVAKPMDMTYYSGFPDGHHRYDAGADDLIEREMKWHYGSMYYSGFPDGHHRYDAGADDLIERESNWAKSLTNYSGFPDGHHNFDYDTLREVRERDEVLTNNLMYYSGFPNGWHVRADFEVLERIYKDAKRVELKGVIDAKKKEIESLNNLILDLTTQMQAIEAEVVELEQEHTELVQKLLGFDALLIKLYKADADGNPVLMVENTDFEKKKAHGDIRFEFKAGSLCTLVKYGEHVLWNKGEEGVNEPKLVAFNGSMGLIAVRDDAKAVLYKKENNSDKWNHHKTVERKTAGSSTSRTAAQTGSSAPPAPGALTTVLSASKLELDATSTGTPETSEALNEAEETASVASGGSETNEANESESSSALRGSASSAEGGSSSGGEAASEYSSVFMD